MSAPEKQPAAVVHRQPVVNIGMVGHVDHGKCIALDEPLLLNNDWYNGNAIIQEKCATVNPTVISESERLFEIPNLRAFSLSPSFELVSVPAKVFVQNYDGVMIELATKDGKRLKASPEHPLLVNIGTEVVWKKAKELKKGDFVGALKKIPSTPVIKDPFPNWSEELQKTCWQVSKTRAQELAEKTNNFSTLECLTVPELNEVRILARISASKLTALGRTKDWGIVSGLKNGSLTQNQKRKVIDALQSLPIVLPKGLRINLKSNSKCFADIQINSFDDSVFKFLAFIIGEGHITESSIRIAQAKNALLHEFMAFCTETFGITPRYQGMFDYHLNNAAVVQFLKKRYGVRVGNSQKAGIPAWIFSLPNEKLAVFLRAFFSAEGTVNTKSRQVGLVQANKQSIDVVSYALKKFGISHAVHPTQKAATNTPQKTKRTYWQLQISDQKSLSIFSSSIGFDLEQKQEKLKKLLSSTHTGKKTDRMIPLRFSLLSELVKNLGLKKNNFSRGNVLLKQRKWRFAYQDCCYKNAISEDKMNEILEFFEKRKKELKTATQNESTTVSLLAEWDISQKQVAKASGFSQKIIWQALNNKGKEKQARLNIINAGVQKILENKEKKADALFEQIKQLAPASIEWCKIKQTEKIQYRGPIIDLQVPGYHNFICGTGALISHNTSLTQALTGKWTDTHSEEIKRGISIRLGYADAIFFECPNCTGAERFSSKPVCGQCNSPAKERRRVSFVDAPGHETLLTTMLSGAAVMDGALLVIAANESCPQPSTTEHMMALKIAGIEKIVVVQNKVDLVSKEDALKNFAQIKAFLKENGFENAPIIPTAAHFRLNIDLLIEGIETFIPTPHKDPALALRLFAVRSFDINKPGTLPENLQGGVIGGSIAQGSIEEGELIEISPGFEKGPLETKVISIHTTFGSIPKAVPGGLLALGTLLDPDLAKNDQLKGQLIGKKGQLPKPTNTVHLKLFPFKRLIEGSSSDLKVHETVVLTVGTGTAVGTVSKVSKDTASIVLKNPITVEKNQKIVISKHQKSGWRLAAYGTCN